MKTDNAITEEMIDGFSEELEAMVLKAAREKLTLESGKIDKYIFVGTLLALIMRLHHGLDILDKKTFNAFIKCAYKNLGEENDK